MPCSGLGNNRMRKCPVCSVDLVPLDYEGVRLHHCPDCRGYLVAAGAALIGINSMLPRPTNWLHGPLVLRKLRMRGIA